MNSSISSSRRLTDIFLLACAVALALLVGASEWLVRAKVLPEDTLYKHVALFRTAASPYAAFGDSHVARGFDAAAPVVNLAYPSENIEKMAWKAERYLERTPNPRTVLIQADPHLFSPYRTGAGLDDYPQAFSKRGHGGLVSLSARYRPQLPAFWRSFLNNGGRLTSRIETTAQGALLSPGDLSRWSEAQIDEFTSFRAALHIPEPGFETSRNADLYRSMVKAFVKAGAEVCLVSFPTSPIYRAGIEAQNLAARAEFARADEFFRAFAADPKVRYIDDRERFDDLSLFRDPDHLNKKGAMLYGPMLQARCFDKAGQGGLAASIAATL